MFCKELRISNEEFLKKIKEFTKEKVETTFELDKERLGTADKLRKYLEMDRTIKFFNMQKTTKTTIYCGTVYENGGMQALAYIAIDIQNPNKCLLSVYSPVQPLREVVSKNLLEFMTRIK